MHFKSYVLLLLTSLLFFSCKNNQFPAEVNTSSLKYYANQAINGDAKANKYIGNLFDSSFTGSELKFVSIDSLIVDNEVYYFLLTEFVKNELNRFAIYNSSGNLLLLDKSLNGNLSIRKDYGSQNIISVNEDFSVLDTINISRTSLYNLSEKPGVLFKFFNRIHWNKVDLKHDIIRIAKRYIKMGIYSSDSSIMRDTTLEYPYNPQQNIYDNSKGYFDLYVSGLIHKLSYVDTTTKNYSLNISKNWVPVKDFIQSKFLVSPLKGDKYINDVIGASIFVTQVKNKVPVRKLIGYELANQVKGDYVVRFTDKIEVDNYYVIYFEFISSNTRYLMLLEVLKNNYIPNKEMFENVVNLFYMES